MSEPSAWLRRAPGAPPLVVAHRGASALAPENTLAAFRLAIDLGAPAVECDVHLSADGVPVVIHDARVDRTTSGAGEVAALSLTALRRLDAGAWFGRDFAGQRLPTLEETLAACAGRRGGEGGGGGSRQRAGRARLFVELKPGGGLALVEAALRALEQAPIAEVAVISFDPEEVRLVSERRPDVALGLLVSAPHVRRHGPAAVLRATIEAGAGFVAPHFASATSAFIAAAHAAGLPVSAWTVDDPAAMRSLAQAEVDAITTNHPDVALLECGRLTTA